MIDKLQNYGSDNSSELSQGLRHAVEQVLRDDAPQAEMEQALGRATAAHRPHRRTQRRLPVYQVISWGVAASLLVACFVALWRPRSSHAWEDVAKSIKTKPWLHLKPIRPTAGQEGEVWISIEKRITAEKSDRRIVFSDIGKGVVFRYEKDDGKIRQKPLSEEEKQVVTLFGLMFEATIKNKLNVKFAETGFRLTGQKIRTVTIKKRAWTVYDFTFEHKSKQGVTKSQISFFVDPDKQLPLRMKYQARHSKGYREEQEMAIDYPDKGPESIYDLGVPRTAEVIPIDSADKK